MKDLKELLKEKYTDLAKQADLINPSSCCGGGTCSSTAALLNKGKDKNDADSGIKINFKKGDPIQYTPIQSGEVVVDLGSAMGHDCFIARNKVGDSGLVIGLDITEAMIKVANNSCDKHGFQNVQFRLGDIENMPIASQKADVVISDNTFRMLTDKKRGVSEIYRILKSKGSFCISDIFWKGTYSESALKAAEQWVGDMSESIPKDLFLSMLQMQGFSNIQVMSEEEIIIPDEVLLDFMSDAELVAFNKSNSGIFLVTIYGDKPDCGQCSSCTCM
jgi:ubiquinone/menaquinone biosynthesis C-methylase UbiE